MPPEFLAHVPVEPQEVEEAAAAKAARVDALAFDQPVKSILPAPSAHSLTIRPRPGKGQMWDMSQLTMSPTMQPTNTSATLCTPFSTPVSFECCASPEAMTMAAVIGACRHMV